MTMSIPKDCKIIDIRPGKGERAHILYAKLVDNKGVLLIAATLDHIVARLNDMNNG